MRASLWVRRKALWRNESEASACRREARANSRLPIVDRSYSLVKGFE